MTSSHQEDQQNEDWTQEAEDSLEELELKRKLDDQVVHAGRKPKRLRMERLEGWVVCTSPEEGVRDGRDDQLVVKDDWKEVTMPLEDMQRKRQTSIQEWTGKRARVDESVQEVENVPEGRKIVTITSKATQRKRTT